MKNKKQPRVKQTPPAKKEPYIIKEQTENNILSAEQAIRGTVVLKTFEGLDAQIKTIFQNSFYTPVNLEYTDKTIALMQEYAKVFSDLAGALAIHRKQEVQKLNELRTLTGTDTKSDAVGE